MNVICLEDAAFYALVEEVVERLKEKDQSTAQDKWLSTDEAMHLLRISSKTTLAALRNEGKIRYTQPQKKIILYDRDSIMEHLEKHSNDTF